MQPHIIRNSQQLDSMRTAKFCIECGERIPPKGWRARFARTLCTNCAQRLGPLNSFRSLVAVALVGAIAFAIGKYTRPSPPPLIIQRAANSPLSDLPVNVSDSAPVAPHDKSLPAKTNTNVAADDVVYICGARTKKGTPCRRRVHAEGERCFQHKGMAAMVAAEKLVIRP